MQFLDVSLRHHNRVKGDGGSIGPGTAVEANGLMNKRVLLIGGEATNFEKLGRKLELRGHSVSRAADGQDALRNGGILLTDLLLIDLDVPADQGPGILFRIVELNPALEVIGVTERTDQPPLAFGARLSAIVEKPIDVEGVVRLMEELLTQVRKDSGGFRQVPRKSVKLPDPLPRRVTEPHICPAAYSGWGINE
jgi:CheY-like chemotaxis protein